jgi:hypothetical protein
MLAACVQPERVFVAFACAAGIASSAGVEPSLREASRLEVVIGGERCLARTWVFIPKTVPNGHEQDGKRTQTWRCKIQSDGARRAAVETRVSRTPKTTFPDQCRQFRRDAHWAFQGDTRSARRHRRYKCEQSIWYCTQSKPSIRCRSTRCVCADTSASSRNTMAPHRAAHQRPFGYRLPPRKPMACVIDLGPRRPRSSSSTAVCLQDKSKC